MIETMPLISLTAFVIAFIAILFVARAGFEIFVYFTEKKSPSSVRAQDRRIETASKAVKNYYNRNYDEIKGA